MPRPGEAEEKKTSTTEWFRDVRWTPENDLRAHRIALTYSTLGAQLDRWIHDDDPDGPTRIVDDRRPDAECNANWCHFATWAALTVTRNIANERPPQRIDSLPFAGLRRELTPLVIHARAADGQRVSRALAWGQVVIFVSVSYALRALLDEPDAPPESFTLVDENDHDRHSSTANSIVKLTTSRGNASVKTQHLHLIQEACRCYAHAHAAGDDAVARARCVLGGNLLLTAVEQELIDDAIAAVVDHVPQHLVARAEWRVARWVERHLDVPSQITSLTLPFRYPQAHALLDAAWSRLMTDQVFVLALPAETLRLGRDIPPLRPGHPYFPAPLRELRQVEGHTVSPTVLRSVADLVECFDRTTGDGQGSAARDWRSWGERMNWATTLMRSRQQDGTLFWWPYSSEDKRRIIKHELPHRSGDPSSLEVQAPLGI